MNRRQVFLFGAASPFAIAAADVGESVSLNTPEPRFTNQFQKYWVVFAFDRVLQDFVLPGIFTLEEDAKACAEKLKKHGPSHYDAIGVTQQPHMWVVETLLSARLGRLNETLRSLEAHMSPLTIMG